jgi:diguanylate cyclase (GGDEF)-like protein
MPNSLLLVDDDPMIRRMGQTLLQKAGYDVRVAGDGAEALELIREDPPDIVLTDWLMPNLDGIGLCRAIREAEDIVGRIYVVILTAQSQPERLVEAFDAGADDYLGKPFHRSELVARIGAGSRMVALKQDVQRKEVELHRRNAELELAYQELSRANRRLDAMATTDELTGLQNRRSAMTAIERRWEEVSRHGGMMSFVMMDIDHFKNFNDTWGHDVGDLVLREVAGTLSRCSRATEDVFRLGGEEFLLFCHSSSAHDASVVSERIRRTLEHTEIVTGTTPLKVTISLGVADRQPWMTLPNELFKAADEALYAAKHAGRNRVMIARPTRSADEPFAADGLDATVRPTAARLANDLAVLPAAVPAPIPAPGRPEDLRRSA